MKIAMIIVGLLFAVTGCTASPGTAASTATATAGTATAPAGTTTTPAGPDGRCSKPFPGNDAITACVYPDGLYSVSYPDENQYYWHPANGDFAVAETFYKNNAPGRAAGAWTGRAISVGDSCVISDNWIPNAAHPPSDCMDSRDEEVRGATGEEQRSVLDFWRIMTKYVPAAER